MKYVGNGSPGQGNGFGTIASLGGPDGIAVNSLGTVYVSEKMSHRVRMISNIGTRNSLWLNRVQLCHHYL